MKAQVQSKIIEYLDVKPNKYLVYDDGRIYSFFTSKFLKPKIDKDGYLEISLPKKEIISLGYPVATVYKYYKKYKELIKTD